MFFLPSRSRFAFDASVENLAANRGGFLLWTFTFVEVLDVDVARGRWSLFLKHFRSAQKCWRVRMSGLRVFELHPGGHGLHVHVVTNRFWGVNRIRRLWQLSSIGGGRVHVLPIPVERAKYAGKYLRKQGRPECFQGVRMWSSFGGGEYCRVRDVEIDCDWKRIFRALRATLGRTWDELRWFERKQAVANVERELPWYFGLGFSSA